MRVSIMFRPEGSAPARAALVASILEQAGHEVVSRPLARSPAALLGAVRHSPDVIHACGSDAWRAAGLTARIARAAVVYEPLDGSGDAHSARRSVTRGVRAGRGGTVLASDEDQASELRSALSLPYLPPVVGALEPAGGFGGGADVLTAVYDRLPQLNPALPAGHGGAGAKLSGRLIRELVEPIRQGALHHPGALLAYLRGRRLRARGRSTDAAPYLARARTGDPDNTTYALYLARALREAGSLTDATAELRELALGIEEREPWAVCELGVEFARLSLTAEAGETVRSLSARGEGSNPGAANALAEAAEVCVALGDLGAGRELASRAAALAPDRSQSQRMAAQVLERAGEPSAAMELARRSGAAGQQRRLSGLLRTLEPGWAPRLDPALPVDRAADPRVLCLLEVSLPHAPSGYAYRSRDLMAAIRAAGLDPAAATRLGFPASRGVTDYSPVESSDDVVQHRFNFPGLRQYSGIPIDRQVEVSGACALELVERIRPRLVIAGTPYLNGAVALGLRSAVGTPAVYDVRDFPEMSWATRPGGAETELYRRRRDAEIGCAGAADAVITLSETMRAELVGRGLDPDRAFIVPHVVDTGRYSPRPRDEELARSYGIEGNFTVGCITSLREYEGIDTLLRAVASARARRPEIAALIVGDGPARASLQALAAELGIEDAVVFTGRIGQDRVPQHHSLLDVFVLPRHDLEICRAVTPLKPYEAMAMGTPVIASDLPALAELISASGGGRTVDPGSDRALAAAILELAGDRSSREELASNAREYAVAYHTPARATAAIRSALGPLLP
jgi:glycosyltransferase involved in cell wall biosynthesis/tetratricopeptide (TPR) repeat protein